MIFGLITTVIIIYTAPACADFWRSNHSLTHNNARCKDDYRMITYEDLKNLNTNFFTVSSWIDASAEYSPWVVYKGIYRNIQKEKILDNTTVTPGEEFTTCIQFCSVYTWTYIGLQVKKCYCLSPEASRSAYHSTRYTSTPCRHGYLPQCALENENYTMAVYQKDNSNIKVVGECLIAITIDGYSFSSYQPTDCQATKAYAACVTFEGRNKIRFSPREMERENISSYCSIYGNVPDINTINTTELSSRFTKGNCWVSNFRQSLIIKQDNSKINHNRQYCVTAKASRGIIRHKISNCTEKNFVLCIKTGSATVQRSGSDLLIVIGAVGGCFAVLLLTGIIIALRKRYFQRSDLKTQTLPVEYAVVQNKRGITSGSEDLRDTDENVNTSEENTYDHTNTSRPSLPHSTGGGLYDTMATVQEIVTGEPVYQHSSHRPSKSHEGNSQAADPLYDHMTN